jgi:hypothetical protein
VTLGGSTLAIKLADNYVPLAGDQFILILNQSSQATTGQFGNVPNGTGAYDVGYYHFTIHYDGNFDGGSIANDVYLTVPEPNTWTMLAGGLGMALGLQRFRRRRQS